MALVAVLALPAFAYAAGTFSGEYPANGATVATPAVIAVDLVGAPALRANTAKISINGTAYNALVTQASAGLGHWTSTAVLQPNGSYKITWAWVGGAGANATIYVYPPASALGNGAKAITLTVTDVANVVHTDAWAFTVALPVVTPPTPPAAANQTCRSSNCHGTTWDTAVEMGPNCTACHTGAFAPHDFAEKASGHNTTLFGVKGAKTKFDGSQGVTLEWESEFASATLNSTYATNLGVTSVTTGQIGVLKTQWDFPTSYVFWEANDTDAPASAIKALTKDSVVTCEDCHTGLAAAGPQGAAAMNTGLDPNYPGDYSYAQLTKWVTCNPQFPTTSPQYTGSPAISASGISMFPGAATHANITSTSVNATGSIAGWLSSTQTGLSARTDGTKGATAVICAKCHDLEDINSAGAASGDNTAHNSHHQDNLDGSPQCVNCHVGVPHGWTRPRLLVNTDVDKAPMFDPEALGTTRTTSTGSTNVGNTIKGFGLGQGTAFGSGFNRQGMQSLSGFDQHLVITGQTNGTNGMTNWTESSCQACADHAGEDGVRMVEGE
jgi:hypothetical protein